MRRKENVDSYWGENATNYDEERADDKWQREAEVFEQLLDLTAPTVVFDCPVGTGRWLSAYNKRFPQLSRVIAADISDDMLSETKKKSDSVQFELSLMKQNVIKDGAGITRLEGPGLVVCTRFLNWLTLGQTEKVLRSIATIEPKWIILSLRYRHSLSEYSELKKWKRIALRRFHNERILYHHNRENVLRTLRACEYRMRVEMCVESSTKTTFSYFLFESEREIPAP